MNRDQEHRHLAQANRHIAEVNRHIAQQRKMVEKLKAGNHATEAAESMLAALEGSLRAFECRRQLILNLLHATEATNNAGRIFKPLVITVTVGEIRKKSCAIAT